MEIRTANPDDEGNIAELLYSSGPELYDFIYTSRQTSALDFIRFEVASEDGFCGYESISVVVDEGRVVGTGCFYGRVAHRKRVLGTVKNMFRFFGPLRVWPALWRARHTRSVMHEPRPDELYLANLAVSPERRGTGIATKLIQAQLTLAKEQGYRVFGLDVATNNPRAEALYRSLGLEVVETKVFSAKGTRVPDCRKMELAL